VPAAIQQHAETARAQGPLSLRWLDINQFDNAYFGFVGPDAPGRYLTGTKKWRATRPAKNLTALARS